MIHFSTGRVDENGKKVKLQRVTYINSFDLAVDARESVLSPEAVDTIAKIGPYTQDFARILPILDLQACDAFMGSMLKDTASRLSALPFNERGNVKCILIALLGRPKVNCGDPSYLTDLAPLMGVDTNNAPDMVRIVRHAKEHYGRSPLVLRMTGDGQSCITLSWLKRRWPELYKNVLITNGHFHSHAHFMLQGVRLFWACFYGSCAKHLHLYGGQKNTIDPTFNNLEGNNYMQYTSFIYSVHVASIVFIVMHVKEPPPELFLSNPVRISTTFMLVHVNSSLPLPMCLHTRL